MPTVTGKVYIHSKRLKEKRVVLDGVAAELRRIVGEPTEKAVDEGAASPSSGPRHGLRMDRQDDTFGDVVRKPQQPSEGGCISLPIAAGQLDLLPKHRPALMGRNAAVRHSRCKFRMPDRRSESAGSRSPRAVCVQRELVRLV